MELEFLIVNMAITYPRELKLRNLLKSNSLFLFGARGTGKSSLIKATLKPDYYYDLLNAADYTIKVFFIRRWHHGTSYQARKSADGERNFWKSV